LNFLKNRSNITSFVLQRNAGILIFFNVVVLVNGKEVRMPVRDFAALAVEDVTNDAVGTSPKG